MQTNRDRLFYSYRLVVIYSVCYSLDELANANGNSRGGICCRA